jgi:hypothetical protein
MAGTPDSKNQRHSVELEITGLVYPPDLSILPFEYLGPHVHVFVNGGSFMGRTSIECDDEADLDVLSLKNDL